MCGVVVQMVEHRTPNSECVGSNTTNTTNKSLGVIFIKVSSKDKTHVFEFETDVSILLLGDVHNGAQKSRFDLVEKVLKEYPHDYFVQIGDFNDVITKNSVGNVHEAKKQIQEQIDDTTRFFKLFKDRFLGIVGGNHDKRIYKDVGFDYLKSISEMFEIPYSPTFLVLDINITGSGRGSKNRNNYVIALHHGYSGGRTFGTTAKQLDDFETFLDGIDIYVTGHTHRPTIIPFRKMEYDRKNKKILYRDGYKINTSSFIDLERYAEEKLLRPQSFAIPRITLLKNERKILTEFVIPDSFERK